MMMEDAIPSHEDRLDGIKGPDFGRNEISGEKQIFPNFTPEQSRLMKVYIDNNGESMEVSLEQALAIIQNSDEQSDIEAFERALDQAYEHDQDMLNLEDPTASVEEYTLPIYTFVLPGFGTKDDKIVNVAKTVDGECDTFNLGLPIKVQGFEAAVNGADQVSIDITKTIAVGGEKYALQFRLPEVPAKDSYVKSNGHGFDVVRGSETWKKECEAMNTESINWASDANTEITQFVNDYTAAIGKKEADLKESEGNEAILLSAYKDRLTDLEDATNNAEAKKAYDGAVENIGRYWESASKSYAFLASALLVASSKSVNLSL
jgi:hypothetical protein